MKDNFFIRYAPFNISLIVLALNIIGYLSEQIAANGASAPVWLAITLINMAFAFKCGQFIQSLYRGTYRDSLTGLNNRGFFRFVTKELEQIPQDNTLISVLMVDIDNFKEVNDSYGHLAGDSILKEVAAIFTQCIRDQDVIIRWGGEEFVVILKETSLETARKIAERVRTTVERHQFAVQINPNRITISIGIATIAGPANLNHVIRLADKALYKAKRLGRNRVAISNEIA